jgi:hypothetical protein
VRKNLKSLSKTVLKEESKNQKRLKKNYLNIRESIGREQEYKPRPLTRKTRDDF